MPLAKKHSHEEGQQARVYERAVALAAPPPPHEARGSFVKLVESREPARELISQAVQVILDPGDLLVWDSRTIHCNQGLCSQCRRPADTAALRHRPEAPLTRLVAYIAMLPANRLTPALAAARRACVREGRGTGHDATLLPRGGRRVSVHPAYAAPDPGHALWDLVAPR